MASGRDDLWQEALEAIPMGRYTTVAIDTTAAIDMLDFWERRRDWSFETFGPPSHRGPVGPLKHLAKEAQEALSATDADDLKEEIVDCLFLVFDAADRAGIKYGDLAAACKAKLAKNKARIWPDWRTVPADVAIEHDRSGEVP